MSRARLASCLLLVFALFGLSACESTSADATGECTKSTTKSAPTAGVHGTACTSGGQCQYGICAMSSLQMSGVAGGVCTKDCSCGPGSDCDDDDDTAKGLDFECMKVGARSECALRCTSDAFCADKHKHLPFCVPNGASKFCAAKPAE